MDVRIGNEKDTVRIILQHANLNFDNENGSVDGILKWLRKSMTLNLQRLSKPGVIPAERLELMSAHVDQVASELVELTRSQHYRENPLIAARIRGIGLDAIANTAEEFAEKIRDYLPPEAA